MKALVLSGGGAKGAAEVGVLDYLLEQNPNLDYDIYAGVSVGALNSAILASGPLSETVPQLKDVWLKQVKGNRSVWSHHLWHYILYGIIIIILFFMAALVSFIFSSSKILTATFFILGLLSFYFPYRSLNNSHSIYNNEPLRKLLSSNLNLEKLKNSGKKLVIGTVSFNSGKYSTIRDIDDKVVDWVIASSAFPIFFPMSHINDEYWVDGGLMNNVPLQDAINLGAMEIDVILTSPIGAGQFNGNAAIIKQFMRNVDIVTSKLLFDDIDLTGDSLKNIKIRFFIVDRTLTSNLLDFSPNKIKNMFQEGRKLAEKVLTTN